VPKWGRDNPNLYATVETGLDLLPAVTGMLKSTPLGILAAGPVNAASQYAKRKIAGEETTGKNILGDIAKGMAIETGGRAVGSILNSIINPNTANRLIRSAGKFGTGSGLTPAEQKAMAQTVLDKGYLFKPESHDALLSTVKANTDAVDDIYRAGTEAGDTFRAEEVLNRGNFPKWQQRGEDVRGVDPGYKGSLDRIMSTFRRGEGVTPAEFSQPSPLDAGLSNARPQMIKPEEVTTPYTPTDLNVSKRQLYQNIGNAYKNGAVNDATETGSKELASAIKTTLDEKYPGAVPFNTDSAELLALEPYFARAINRISQRDVVGLGEKIALGSIKDPVSLSDMSPSTIGKLVAAVWDRPEIKSRVAQAMFKASKNKSLAANPELKRAFRSAVESSMYGVANGDPLGIR
jgi:hypothetical protein